MRLEGIHILRVTFLTEEPEDQLPRLCKLAVEFLQADHRLELRRQQVQTSESKFLRLTTIKIERAAIASAATMNVLVR